MWKCSECGEYTQGLFCTNCGAPMTEEGEKLNINPIAEEAPILPVEEIKEETPIEVKATFNDVLAQIVRTKKMVVAIVLLIIYLATNLINFQITSETISLNFRVDIFCLVLVCGLVEIYKKAKGKFTEEGKTFEITRGASVFIAVCVVVLGSIFTILVAFASVLNLILAREGEPFFGDLFAQNGQLYVRLGDEIKTISTTGIDLANFKTITGDVVFGVLLTMAVIVIAVVVIIAIVHFNLAKMSKSITNKLKGLPQQLFFPNRTVKAIRVYSVLSIIFSALAIVLYSSGIYSVIQSLTLIGGYVAYLMLTGLVIQLQIKTEELENQEA